MPKIIFKFEDTETVVDAVIGDTLLETAKKTGYSFLADAMGPVFAAHAMF